MFVCETCSREYKYAKYLIMHREKCFTSDKNAFMTKLMAKGELYLCSFCGLQFAHSSSLHRHERVVHQVVPSAVTEHTRCSICDFSSHKSKIMDQHLQEDHKIPLIFEEKQFRSFTDFISWKASVEKQTSSSFVRHRGIKTHSDGTKLYTYYCHRSGIYTAKSTGKRDIKLQASCKVGYCPAKLKIVECEDGACHVSFLNTHVGHKSELGHLCLQQQECEQIAAHISLNTILDEVRNSIIKELDRINLITKKDLHIIEHSFSLNSDFMRYQDDGTSVSAWVKQMQDSGNMCVLFYKPPGKKYPDMKVDDFALVIMNDAQCSMLQKYGSDCICMDRTHCLNSYGYELITVLVLDELRQGFPCAFLISNRCDQIVLSIFLEHVKQETGTLSPNVFMSDMAEAFYNAWCCVMVAPKHRLYCTWHVDRVWRKNISNVAMQEKQVVVYKLIRTIMEERELAAFSLILDAGVKMLCDDPDTSEFGEYFQNCYVPCKKMWAYCYRLHCGLNTNMYIEAMHKSIKYIYLHGKSVKRLDKAMHAIMTFVRDKIIDKLIAIHKDKIISKVTDLRKRHKASTLLSEDHVIVNGNSWEIDSSSATKESYKVEQGQQSCDCKIVCEECNTCIHKYKCNCPDSAIKWNMCKHIHLVCRVQNKTLQQMEINTTAPLVVDLVGTQENDACLLVEALQKPESTTVSLQEKKQALLQKMAESINDAETEEEIKAIEEQLAPINGIVAAIRNNVNVKLFGNSTTSMLSNKNVPQQRLFKVKKSEKRPERSISSPTSKEV